MRAVEGALVELGLEEVLQLLLAVAAPVAPCECIPRVNFLNFIFRIEKLINILSINGRYLILISKN